jgi:hypothetical protein
VAGWLRFAARELQGGEAAATANAHQVETRWAGWAGSLPPRELGWTLARPPVVVVVVLSSQQARRAAARATWVAAAARLSGGAAAVQALFVHGWLASAATRSALHHELQLHHDLLVRDPPQKTTGNPNATNPRRPGSGLSCGWPPCGE